MDVPLLLSRAKYSYQDRSKNDIKNVLNQYRSLKAVLEKCEYPNLINRDLICLKGTIPVMYRGSYYNIPVNIWVLNNYPYSAPLCWVNPTKDMTIKVSQHVNREGRVFLPYLSDWNAEESDLLGVIQVMIIAFGQLPPLFSKPKDVPSTTLNTVTPPYPMNNRFPGSNQFAGVYPAIQPVTMNPPSSFSQSSNPGYPYPSSINNVNASTDAVGNKEGISKEQIHLSLMSALEDKLKSRSREIASQYNAEIEVLRKTSDDLNKGKARLESLVKTIETNLVELAKCNNKIRLNDSKITDTLAKMDSPSHKLNIDECFGPIQPLYKQLLNAFVEENSIVDTIFYLNEALQKGVITLDVFIKHCRELSRRQFMMRALIKSCRERAGLPI